MVLAVAHPNPWSSASFYLPSQSLTVRRFSLDLPILFPRFGVASLAAGALQCRSQSRGPPSTREGCGLSERVAAPPQT